MGLFQLPGFDYSSGNQTGNFISKIANEAADFVCGIYRDYPGAVVSDTSPNSFGRGLMDSLCNGRGGLPPPPTPKQNGGQCACRAYDVTFNILDDVGEPLSYTLEFPGAILGIFTRPYADGSPNVDFYIKYGVGCNGVTAANAAEYIVTTESEGSPRKFLGMSVSPVDGLPDECGGSGHDWNPSLPTIIPPERRVGDITIDYNDGTDIVVPVVYINTNPVLNFNPNVNIDVGGVQVTFDFSGAKIDFGNSNSSPDTPRDRNNTPSDDFDRLDRAVKDLKRNFDDLKDDISDIKKDKNDSPPPQDDPDIEEVLDEEPKNSDEKDVDNLQYVCIHLTKLPDRVQSGDGAPNVYYAGWLEFKVKGCNLPRQPIHFEDSIFKAPEGATGFAYTLTNNAEGTVKVYKTKVTAT